MGHPVPPRVSVVIAAFNAQECLARAVESVFAQDFDDLEVVVVDDGSTDATLSIARELAARDARLRCFSLGRNQGPSAARNRGLQEARGEWVSILDADDAFLPGRLGHLLEVAERRHADMVADDLLLYDLAAEEVLPPAFGWAEEHALTLDTLLANDASMKRAPLGWVQPVWRREFLRANDLRYPQQFRYMEDFFLLASALLCGASIWLSPRAEYVYTMRVGPVSGQPSRFSVTQPLAEHLTGACDELVRRYGSALAARHVRALRRLQHRFSVRKAMADALAVRREHGVWRALKGLRGHPVAACKLAVQKAAGTAYALWRRAAG
jgi:succinoglycan biosynthesis protein ExoO